MDKRRCLKGVNNGMVEYSVYMRKFKDGPWDQEYPTLCAKCGKRIVKGQMMHWRDMLAYHEECDVKEIKHDERR